MEFYAYIHCRPSGEPFYVGKGNRARLKRIERFRNRFHANIVNKYGKENILVLSIECSSETIAFDLERGLIKRLRAMGVEIANATDGGEGVSGLRMSDAAKTKMRNAKSGKSLSKEHKEKLRKSSTGRTLSVDSRRKISVARQGLAFSKEHKMKLRMAKLGKKLTEEHKEKVRQAVSGRRWITDGFRCKMVKESDAMPDGWWLGRILRRQP